MLMDFPDMMGEGVTLDLMRVLDHAHVRVNMAVVGGSWLVENLLALVWRRIWVATRAPSRELIALRRPVLRLH